MIAFVLSLIYVYVGLLVFGTGLVSSHTPDVCVRAGVPGRTTLLPAVAGVIWPVLALCYAAGLVYYGLLSDRRAVTQWE